MTIKDTFRKALFGLTVPQEYICLENEDLATPLHVFATAKGSAVSLNVTANHIFLGYKPVIMAIHMPTGDKNIAWLQQQKEICLLFSPAPVSLDARWRGFPVDNHAPARMTLEKIREGSLAHAYICYYVATSGEHSFISATHQFMNRVRASLARPRSNNITLDANLADQVRIAYAIPRVISLITLRDRGLMNMFPTDLHGPVGPNYYLSSLRQGGKANEQVMTMKCIALSEVRADSYRQVYDLGKNHMRQPANAASFNLADQATEKFGLPLPQPVISYRELIVTDYFDAGIHRIITYAVKNSRDIMQGHRLSHVHQYAAQWRVDHNLPTNMLLR